MPIIDLLQKLFSGSDDNDKNASKRASSPNVFDEIIPYVERLLTEVNEDKDRNRYGNISLSKYDSYEAIKSLNSEEKFLIIRYLIHLQNERISSYSNSKSYVMSTDSYLNQEINKTLLSLLLRSKVVFSSDQLVSIILDINKHQNYYAHYWPYLPLLSQIEKNKDQDGEINPELEKGLKSLVFKPKRYGLSADENKINARIDAILYQKSKQSIKVENDIIGNTILKLCEEDRDKWEPLLSHFASQQGKSTPTKKWLKETKTLLFPNIENTFIEWFDKAIDRLKAIHKEKSYEYFFLTDSSIQFVRAAIWSSALINSTPLTNKVEELGLWCFKKLSGVGSVSVKLGNATIHTFSLLPFEEGIERLTKYRMKIKYRSVLSLIENTIKKVAQNHGKTMDELEEMSVSSFGFNERFQALEPIGDSTAIISISSIHKADITWEVPSGKIQKTIPSHIKEDFKQEIKSLKSRAKEIQTSLVAHRDRIESLFLKKRRWDFSEWKEYYLEHPLISFISHSLIWSFHEGTKHKGDYIYLNGKFVSPLGEISPELLDKSEVTLWHPIQDSTTEVQQWREFLIKKEIQQPFKQAFREIYLVTDAELQTDTYSNRFAAHILRQHQFNALCQQRQWRYTLMGGWDSHNTPTISIPAYGIHVEFWVDADGTDQGQMNEMGIFNYVFTDQVRIYDQEERLHMKDVPPIVFSEVMRDVDLFVGVTSIGNDPNWADSGNERMNTYWHSYSFQDLTESAKIRKQTLEYLIPKLKIKDISSFVDNYLVVKGKLRTYKIHIGSGNILMKPNDQYLCIVPDRTNYMNKVFLPFEGDQTLSVIISKAFLLSEDDKITDGTITSQINRW